jgi:hypothetical protein
VTPGMESNGGGSSALLRWVVLAVSALAIAELATRLTTGTGRSGMRGGSSSSSSSSSSGGGGLRNSGRPHLFVTPLAAPSTPQLGDDTSGAEVVNPTLSSSTVVAQQQDAWQLLPAESSRVGDAGGDGSLAPAPATASVIDAARCARPAAVVEPSAETWGHTPLDEVVSLCSQHLDQWLKESHKVPHWVHIATTKVGAHAMSTARAPRARHLKSCLKSVVLLHVLAAFMPSCRLRSSRCSMPSVVCERCCSFARAGGAALNCLLRVHNLLVLNPMRQVVHIHDALCDGAQQQLNLSHSADITHGSRLTPFIALLPTTHVNLCSLHCCIPMPRRQRVDPCGVSSSKLVEAGVGRLLRLNPEWTVEVNDAADVTAYVAAPPPPPPRFVNSDDVVVNSVSDHVSNHKLCGSTTTVFYTATMWL